MWKKQRNPLQKRYNLENSYHNVSFRFFNDDLFLLSLFSKFYIRINFGLELMGIFGYRLFHQKLGVLLLK